MLGTSNSGKSTCIKQMKILLGKGFSDEDRLLAKVAIQENILDSICTLIAATVQFGLIMDGEFLDIITRLRDGIELEDNSIPLRDVKDLKRLWESKVIQNVMQKAHLLDIQENAAFFLDRIDDVTRTDYVPSDADVLNCRMESPLLIRETYFTLGQISLTLYDVGESRSQNQVRLFWAAFFQVLLF